MKTTEITEAKWYTDLVDYVTQAGYYSEAQYTRVEAKGQRARIRKLALILQDELLYKRQGWYLYEWRMTSLRHLTEDPEKIISILMEATKLLKEDRAYLDQQVSRHKGRVAMQTEDPAYLKWKADIREIYKDHEYCFCCGSTERLEVDHILPHQNFRFRELALDRNNGQLLCHDCNSIKGPVGREDYRSNLHMEALEAWLDKKISKRLAS